MGGGGDAPAYPTTTTDTGLWGTSTTSGKGTTYNPTDFQRQLVGKAENYILPTLDYVVNPTTDNAYYQNQRAVRERAQNEAFENQVVNNLASRNLSRGSAGQNLINSYADSVARQESEALADSQAQASALLSQLLAVYAAPYELMQGTSSLSQSGTNSVANYNLGKYQAEKSGNSTLNSMLGAIGTGVGSYYGSR